MPRLKNRATGVVVNVDDATAARLGPGWAAADQAERQPAAGRERPPTRRPRKTGRSRSEPATDPD